jgi:hypothetical protein
MALSEMTNVLAIEAFNDLQEIREASVGENPLLD